VVIKALAAILTESEKGERKKEEPDFSGSNGKI